MDLNGLLSSLDRIASVIENKEGQKNSALEEFAKALGISSENTDAVRSLIEQYEDNEEYIKSLDKTIGKLDEEIGNLETAINNETDAVKKAEKEKLKGDKERLKNTYEVERGKAETSKGRIVKKLSDKGVNVSKIGDGTAGDAKTANKNLNDKLNAIFKGTGSSIAKFASSPWFKAADLAVKAIQFAFDKFTQYVRLETENMLRLFSATTRVELNKMKVGLESWTDAVQGAYSAQELAIDSQMAMIEAQNANTMANLKMAHTWTNWIPIWKEYNAYSEAQLEREQKMQEARMKFAQQELNLFLQYSKKIDDYSKEQDKSVHQYQVEVGLTAVQTEEFENRMLALGESFGKLNKTIADAIKMHSQFIATAGRNVNLTNEEYHKNFAIGRLVGEDNLMNFEGQMNIFTQSVSDSAEIMYEMYNDANKMGISQRKLVSNVLNNLKLANKYDFKNGIKGFIELSKWAENARFNLSSLGGALEKVQSGGIEGLLKQSAGLQVLGGSFAMGANPLAMLYESYNSPEDYAKRIQSMFSTMGSFNKETGQTTFNMQEQQLIRAASEQLGISVEDAKDMARGARQKEVVKRQMGGSPLKEADRDTVANMAQFDKERKEWYVTMLNGQRKNVGQVTERDLGLIRSNNKERDAVKYAESTLSVAEEIEANTKQISAMLGMLTFDKFKDMSKEQTKNVLNAFSKYQEEFSKTYSRNKEDANKEQLKVLEESIGKAGEKYDNYQKIAKANGKINDETAAVAWRGSNKEDKEAAEYLNKNPNARKKLTDKEKEILYDQEINGGRYWVGSKDDTDYIRQRQIDKLASYTNNVGNNTIGSAIAGKILKYIAKKSLNNEAEDAVASSNGTSMTVEAQNVTPIHDGSVKLAKTDPKDSAIFAKTGGPFDKLFDNIFNKVSQTYSYITNSDNGISTVVDSYSNDYATNSDFVNSANRTVNNTEYSVKLDKVTDILKEINSKIGSVRQNRESSYRSTVRNFSKNIFENISHPLEYFRNVLTGGNTNSSNTRQRNNYYTYNGRVSVKGNRGNNTAPGFNTEILNSVNNNTENTANRNSTATRQYNRNTNINSTASSNTRGGNTNNRYVYSPSVGNSTVSSVNRNENVINRYDGNTSFAGGDTYNSNSRGGNVTRNYASSVVGGNTYNSNVMGGSFITRYGNTTASSFTGGDTYNSNTRGGNVYRNYTSSVVSGNTVNTNGRNENTINRYDGNTSFTGGDIYNSNSRGGNVTRSYTSSVVGGNAYNSNIRGGSFITRYGNTTASSFTGGDTFIKKNINGGDIRSFYDSNSSFAGGDTYNSNTRGGNVYGKYESSVVSGNTVNTNSRSGSFITRYDNVYSSSFTGGNTYNSNARGGNTSNRYVYSPSVGNSTVSSVNRNENVINRYDGNTSFAGGDTYNSNSRGGNVTRNYASSVVGGNTVNTNSRNGSFITRYGDVSSSSFTGGNVFVRKNINGGDIIRSFYGGNTSFAGGNTYNSSTRGGNVNNRYGDLSTNNSTVRNSEKNVSQVSVNGGNRNLYSNSLYSSNPISMLYEAFSNPASFTEKIENAYSNYRKTEVKPNEPVRYTEPITNETKGEYAVNVIPDNIKMSDMNININGKLMLEGQNGQSIDIMNEIRNNPMYIRRITEMIALQFNNNSNGGRNELFHNRYTG